MSIPCWRHVLYTDDGSTLYQCLNCYNQWDARTEPGWFESLVKTEVAVEGGWSFDRGNGVIDHLAKRKEPVYVATWKFCPYCGIRWEGPVPHDYSKNDNERMLGERRLRIQRAISSRSAAFSEAWWKMSHQDREGLWEDVWRAPPAFWWVIQEKVVGIDDRWLDKEYAYGGLMPVKKMLYFLRERRAKLKQEAREARMAGFPNETEVRLIVRRGALPKPKGYEIRNYE